MDEVQTPAKPAVVTVPVKERRSLTGPHSSKSVIHVTLDLTNSGFTYAPGDSIAILPKNSDAVVELTIKALQAPSDTIITDPKTSEPRSLYEHLQAYANLCTVSRKLLTLILSRQTDSTTRTKLESLLGGEGKLDIPYEVHDLLADFPTHSLSAQELINHLQPLLPRFYSIASSQKVVGDELHLTVGLVKYEKHGKERCGVCSNYLSDERLQELSIYLHPTKDFRLPEDHETPIIMIGPGTGVAPFRAFMQERVAAQATGKHWLFFGDRSKHHDFLYGAEWQDLAERGHLRLETAFSRDQDLKVYVQTRMLEHGKELWDALQAGAILYVCGDASRMAKDVEATLLTILETHGQMDSAAAKGYLKTLRASKRYLKDVY